MGVYYIYQLAQEKRITDEVRQTLEVDSGWKTKFTLLKKYTMILVPVLLQVVDSLLDAIYFVKSKTDPRIIHIPSYVHVAQAVLLFTCKLSTLLCLTLGDRISCNLCPLGFDRFHQINDLRLK